MDTITSLISSSLSNLLSREGIKAKVNNIEIMPLTQKYNASVEVVVGEKTRILHSCKDTLVQVTQDISDQYSSLLLARQTASVSKALNSYFL